MLGATRWGNDHAAQDAQAGGTRLCRQRPGRSLAQPDHPHGGALGAGAGDGSRWEVRGAEAVGEPRPDRRGGEPARCRRHDRHRCRGQGDARWLHPAGGFGWRGDAEPAGAADALRSGTRPGTGGDDRIVTDGAGRPGGFPGEHVAGVPRRGPGQSGALQLFLLRRRGDGASQQRVAAQRGGAAGGACALRRQRGIADRRGRRADRLHDGFPWWRRCRMCGPGG